MIILRSFRIYFLQDNEFTFTTVDEFLQKLDPELQQISQSSLRDALKKEKFSEKICQLASAACLANYNQTIDIHAFVGLVSIAGIDAGTWRVKSKLGNKMIPEALLKLSGASLHNSTNVVELRECRDKTEVVYISSGKQSSKLFDYVVIAFPLNKNLDFSLGFDFDYKKYEMRLTKTYFIDGTLCLLPEIPLNKRNEILSCDDTIDFRGVSIQLPCDYNKKADAQLWLDEKSKLYKVFSRVDLDKNTLCKIFREDYKIVKEIDWYAYPEYDLLKNGEKRKEFPPIIIDSKERSRVFYLNSIEWSTSCMEASCIAARNISLLISKKEQSVEKTKESNHKFYKDPISIRSFVTILSIGVLFSSYFIRKCFN